MHTTSTRTRLATASAAAALAAMVTGCSGSTGGSTTGAATTSTIRAAAASASATASSPSQLALAAYTAMWADVQAVGLTSNYQDPRLAAHLDGTALLTISENMAADKAHGIVNLGTPVLHPSVISTAASAVTVRDCLDDSHWLQYYAADNKLVDNVPGGHRYVAATVTDENGTWKVTTLDTRGEGTC